MPEKGGLVVGSDQVCMRTQPGRFACAGKFASEVNDTSALTIQHGGWWFRRDLKGQWYGTHPDSGSDTWIGPDPQHQPILRFRNATQLNVGNWSHCFLRGGTVQCWGFNEMAQLGFRSTESDCYFMRHAQPCALTPQEVPGLSQVLEVVGESGRCARREDKSVWCWGDLFAQRTPEGIRVVMCSNNAECFPPAPRRIEGLPPMIQIVGEQGFLGVDASGQVFIWGHSDTQAGQFTAERLTRLSGVRKLSATESRQGCALHLSGEVTCWKGLFAERSPDPSKRRVFTTVQGIRDAVDVEVSPNLACARLSDQTVWCWGEGARELRDLSTRGSEQEPWRVLPRQKVPPTTG